MLAGAIFLASPLVIATQLRPAIDGLGTHQQLGLPPCTTRRIWGVRCPACGMTTSWAHLVRGDVVSSAKSNLGGLILGLIDISLVVVLAAHAGRSHWPERRWFIALAIAMGSAVSVALVDWAWRAWAVA